MLVPYWRNGGTEGTLRGDVSRGRCPNGKADRSYLVLGGDGWTLRDYFTSGQLAEHLVHAALVRVVNLEAFIRLANSSKL